MEQLTEELAGRLLTVKGRKGFRLPAAKGQGHRGCHRGGVGEKDEQVSAAYEAGGQL